MIKLIISGCPRSKKNSMQIVGRGSFHRLIPSKYYSDYEKRVIAQLPEEAKKLNISTPVNLKCSYFMETRRRVDLCNLLEATCDILVKAGVIQDDNSSIIVSHDGSRVLYDKANPRVEVTITKAKEYPPCVDDKKENWDGWEW